MKSNRSDQRNRGAYYTPNAVAEYMAAWLMAKPLASILEPSAGDGAFLRAIAAVAKRKARPVPFTTAVELSRAAIQRASEGIAPSTTSFVHSDFLLHTASEYGAVIGNPPFVRLRHLPIEERKRAMDAAEATLGHGMDPSGSVWMPFVLHACGRLRKGGRLAMVLPLELTYVRYARPFWHFLHDSFNGLRVVRVRERLFPDISQDVVLLFADGAGGKTSTIRFEAFADLQSLLDGTAETRCDIDATDVVRGERAFLWALLNPELQDLLENRLHRRLVSAGQIARFRIGYVAGDKAFFHPSRDVAKHYVLQRQNLVATIASARSLRRSGLFTSGTPSAKEERLFLPLARELNDGEAAYVKLGEKSGVADAYKCRVRSPWYVVPYVTPPDIVMSVFSDRPLIAINDAGKAVSNSFLCGTLLQGTPEAFACRWYNSLTLLQCELNVHSLGGGVFVLVPREASAVKLLRTVSSSRRLLAKIDLALRSGDLSAAYECGDHSILSEREELSATDIALIQEGVSTLCKWRNPPSQGEPILGEQLDEQLALLEA